MHSLVESLVYGRGGNDYVRDAESEDRLLQLLFLSTEVTQVPHRATFYASAVILFLNMLVLVWLTLTTLPGLFSKVDDRLSLLAQDYDGIPDVSVNVLALKPVYAMFLSLP